MEDQDKVLIDTDMMYQKFKSETEKDDSHICIILGAGASYGYSPTETYNVPPIVGELFDDDNPLVSTVIRREKHKFILGFRSYLEKALKTEGDLEKFLSSVYRRNGNEDGLFSSLIFYLQDIFYLASDRITDGENNYKDLVNHLFSYCKKSQWSCITFNYDTLLEQSYMLAERDETRSFESLESYLIEPKILKMHGGVNFRYVLADDVSIPVKTTKEVFGQMMDGKTDSNENIQVSTPNMKSGNNMPFHNPRDVKDSNGNLQEINLYNFPLMMIPIHGTKRSDHPLFTTMLMEAKEEIAKSTLIIAIGYNFGDELFTDEINDLDLSKKDVILVGTKNLYRDFKEHSSYKNATSIFNKERVRVFEGDGFSDFMESII